MQVFLKKNMDYFYQKPVKVERKLIPRLFFIIKIDLPDLERTNSFRQIQSDSHFAFILVILYCKTAETCYIYGIINEEKK